MTASYSFHYTRERLLAVVAFCVVSRRVPRNVGGQLQFSLSSNFLLFVIPCPPHVSVRVYLRPRYPPIFHPTRVPSPSLQCRCNSPGLCARVRVHQSNISFPLTSTCGPVVSLWLLPHAFFSSPFSITLFPEFSLSIFPSYTFSLLRATSARSAGFVWFLMQRRHSIFPSISTSPSYAFPHGYFILPRLLFSVYLN
jgi:hypothetical protein